MAAAIHSNAFNTKVLNSERFYVDDRLQIVYDIETGDMDDFDTLLFLLGHPLVGLKAITVVPDTPDQIGFIRHVLTLFNRANLSSRVFDMNDESDLSRFHYKVYDATLIRESREASIHAISL